MKNLGHDNQQTWVKGCTGDSPQHIRATMLRCGIRNASWEDTNFTEISYSNRDELDSTGSGYGPIVMFYYVTRPHPRLHKVKDYSANRKTAI
jgi:hypothetical protein